MSFGLWRNWAVYLASIEGIILGPESGFLAALVGSSIARTIRPDVFWMFGIIAEPVSVLVAGFLALGKWKPALAAYTIMLSAYFIHPFGRQLPLWTILDVLVALLLIYPAAKLSHSLRRIDLKRLPISLVLVSFVCIATDSLVRVFLLIPCGFYTLFPDVFGSFENLFAAFVAGAAYSYVEDAIAIVVSLLAGVPLLLAASKLKLFKTTTMERSQTGTLAFASVLSDVKVTAILKP
jgi:hypothetical protein